MLRGWLFTRSASVRVPAGRRPLFYLHPGRSPEHQTKERQQRQDEEASHAANLPYPSNGSLRRAGRMEGAA